MFVRLLTRAALGAIVLTGLVAPATSATMFSVNSPSITGSYLAGQQALKDLSTQDAARFFRQAAEANWSDPELVERAFVALAANGDIDRAASAAKHLLELDRGNELASLVIATQALKERRYGAAINDLEQLGTDNFAGITGSILRAWAYTGDNRVDQAFKMLDEAAGDGLADFLVFHRALMAEVAGRSEESIDLARQAYETDPGVARIVEAYARMLGNAGRFDEAIDVVVQYEAQGLTHPLVDVVKKALADKARPGMFVGSVQSGAAEMYHGIAVALARDGTMDISIVFLRLSLYLDPNTDVVALVLGQLLDGAGRHDAANALYDGIAANSPMKPTAVVRIAQNLDASGDRKEAIRRLSNIVSISPNDLDAVSVLGDLLRYDSQFAAAADTYSKALAIAGGDRPADWRFYYVRGIALERDGRWKEAEPDFIKALELNPDQPQVLNYLGYTWVDQGVNLDRALDMIQRAVQAQPTDGYIVDSLGWAFYKLGRVEEAVEVLEQAVQLKPNDPEINDHLGDAYWQAGRKLEAKFQWNIASSVDEEGAVKKRVEPKLANGIESLPTAVQ